MCACGLPVTTRLKPAEFVVLSSIYIKCLQTNEFATAQSIKGKKLVSMGTVKKALAKLTKLGWVAEKKYSPEKIASLVSDKTPSLSKSQRRLCVCDWCQSEVACLESHHYPIPASKGGTEVVQICGNCHTDFHYLENSKIFEITEKGIDGFLWQDSEEFDHA